MHATSLKTRVIALVAFVSLIVGALIVGVFTLGGGLGAQARALTPNTPSPAGIQVYVAYADSYHGTGNSFPTPLDMSGTNTSNLIYEGCAGGSCVNKSKASDYDGGAIRIDNNSGFDYKVSDLAVKFVDPAHGNKVVCTVAMPQWDAASTTTSTSTTTPVDIPSGDTLILTQAKAGAYHGCPNSGNGYFDTSDFPRTGNCKATDYQAVITFDLYTGSSATPQSESFTDSGQVLNTYGVDSNSCNTPSNPKGTPKPKGGYNESIPWTLVGQANCTTSSLVLTQDQTLTVGSTATVTGTFTNSCGTPLANAQVVFTVSSGPNNGKQVTGQTDSNGVAQFTYPSSSTGTDVWSAVITTNVGDISSNAINVIWQAPAATTTPAPTATSTPLTTTGRAGNGATNNPTTAQAPGNSNQTTANTSANNVGSGSEHQSANVVAAQPSSTFPLALVALLAVLAFALIGGGAVMLARTRKTAH